MSDDKPSAFDRYDDAISKIEKPVTDLREYGRTTRSMMWWLAGSLIIDLVLSLLLGAVALQARKATQTTRTACLASNEFKRLDLQRWNYILDLGKDAPKTGTAAEQAKAAKQRADFIDFIEKADQPDKCP